MRTKGQVGGRHVARMRGAFSWARLAAATAGKPGANVGPSGATRANVGAKRRDVAGVPQESKVLQPPVLEAGNGWHFQPSLLRFR
jgi:hypothetical protein